MGLGHSKDDEISKKYAAQADMNNHECGDHGYGDQKIKSVYCIFRLFGDPDSNVEFDLLCIHGSYDNATACAKSNSKFKKCGYKFEKAIQSMDDDYIYYGHRNDFTDETLHYGDHGGYLIEKFELKK